MTGDSSQKKLDLLSAAEAAVASRPEAAPRHGPGVRDTRWGLVWTCLALVLMTSGAVITLRPEWVFAPDPTRESPELSDASLRLAMVRERQRIEAFRMAEGRLPATVAEVGGNLPQLELITDPEGGYILRHSSGGAPLELRSTDALEGFLGNSLQVILSRGKP